MRKKKWNIHDLRKYYNIKEQIKDLEGNFYFNDLSEKSEGFLITKIEKLEKQKEELEKNS